MMFRTKKRNPLPALLALLVLAAGALFYHVYTPLGQTGLPLEFTVEPGHGLRQTAAGLKQAGVLQDDWGFVQLARLMGKTKKIKFGTYRLEKPASMVEVLELITSGRFAQSQVTLVEGISFRELRKLLDAHPKLRHDSSALTEQEILQRLGASESAAEGLFFPDTYIFAIGSSDLAVLQRAYTTMHKKLEMEWAQRDLDLPFATPYEALTLASVVEKETGKVEDRPMIAAVFINRLRRGMRLQTDPTVIYGLGEAFDGNLRKRDLKADTPYNTYTRGGLPPTPIAMPGLAALHAVLHPPKSNVLYFVARGDGSSAFSNSLKEHNKAVSQYQLKK
ncbi:MAG: endolytic transglycosylase MltG [Pseudomonadota bacterium]